MTAARKLETITGEPERTPLDNPIVRWFESLSEEEKAEYHALAKAGEVFGGDVEAERAAMADGTHPLLAG